MKSGSKTNTFSRVVAVILAVIMLGSVVFVAIQSFALSPVSAAIVNTGDTGINKWIIIGIAAAAILILAGATIFPKLKNKK